MPADTKKIEQAALATLFAIQKYVLPNFFTPIGLAKGLGRKLNEIEIEVQWLKDQGFVAHKDNSVKMYVTHKGWRVDDPESSGSNMSDVEVAPPQKSDTHEDRSKVSTIAPCVARK